MLSSQFELFAKRRFLPIFVTQFLGAFNDNLFKQALVILITYKLAEQYGMNGQMLITVVACLYILPFFLFSALAGQLADKYDKTAIIKAIKFAEIVIMCAASVAFWKFAMWSLIALLFCMGMHSTFFSPIKFSILPQHLKEEELVAANGLVSAGTFIAILLGTLIGGLLILYQSGRMFISIAVLCTALTGWLFCLFIPKAPASNPDLKLNFNLFTSTRQIIQNAKDDKVVFHSILGISWFWFIGAVFLAQCPTFAKDIIGGNEQVTTLFIVVFSVGVGFGSMLCQRVLKGRVTTRFVPFACMGMSLSIFVMALACRFIPCNNGTLLGVADYLRSVPGCIIIVCLFLMTTFGGLYNVPLYAILQARTPADKSARVMACSSMLDSLGMVISAVFSMAFLACKATVTHIFISLAVINLGVMVFIRKVGTNNGN